MSDPKWEDTEELDVPSFDDTVAIDVAPTPTYRGSILQGSAPNPTTGDTAGELKSLGLGAVEGGTMGFADELYGAAKTPVDLIGKGELPTEPRPAGMGSILQGTASPEMLQGRSTQELLDAYRANRDTARGTLEEAKKANPKLYGLGQIGGGVASSMLLPGAGLAKGASIGAKVAQSAGVGATLGGLAGAGYSTADLLDGESAEFAKDVGSGVAVGGGLGASFPMLFQGMGRSTSGLDNVKRTGLAVGGGGVGGAAIGSITSDDPLQGALTGFGVGATAGLAGRTLAGAGRYTGDKRWVKQLGKQYKKGLEGANTSSEQYGVDQVNKITQKAADKTKQFNKLAQEADEAIVKAQQEAAKKTEAIKVKTQNEIKAAQNQLDQARIGIKDNLEQQQIALNSRNYKEFQDLNKKLLEQNKKLETLVANNQNKVGSEIGKISDELASNMDVRFNTLEVVDDIVSDLRNYSRHSAGNVDDLIEGVTQYAGEVDYNRFRQLKDYINKNLAKSSNYELAGIGKKSYGRLNEAFTTSIDDSITLAAQEGLDISQVAQRANQLKQLNKQYTASRELENTMDRAKKFYSLNEKEAATGNVGLLRKLGSDKAEDVGTTQDFGKLLRQLAGEEADAFLQEGTDIAAKLRNVGSPTRPDVFVPSVPKTQINEQIQKNPQLKALLEKAKSKVKVEPVAADISEDVLRRKQIADEFKKNFGSKELTADKKLADLTVKAAQEYDPKTNIELNKLVDLESRAFGKEAGNKLREELTKLSDDFQLGKGIAINPETAQTGSRGLGINLFGRIGDFGSSVVNDLGLATRTTKEVGRTLASTLNDISKNTVGLDFLTNKAVQKGYADIAKTLTSMKDKDAVAKAATLYMLQTNAEKRNKLRELLADINVNVDD